MAPVTIDSKIISGVTPIYEQTTPIYELPAEIYACIASNDIDTWRDMLAAVPRFRKYAQTPEGQHTRDLAFTRVVSNRRGTRHYLGRKFHREDGPAIELVNGARMWYRYGKLHREDGPAYVIPGKYETWCRYGRTHRDGDLPATIHEDGRCEWWNNGERYREGGMVSFLSTVSGPHD